MIRAELAGSSALELARAVVAGGTRARRTVATAESLTGGLLGAVITSVAGSSEVYRGGLITYATDLKTALAGVDPATLARDGAIAATTAEAMARGAADRCGADIGLALTGVAGPSEQEGHPAGTVWLGWCARGYAGSARLELAGDRAAIREGAVRAALERALELVGADSE